MSRNDKKLASERKRETTYIEDWQDYKKQAQIGTALLVAGVATLVIGVNLWRALRT
jgi:hypothetical protein